ncbi:MAG: hypothetical protein JNL62_26790 [Bryobacterales bacterium]|nr:hypothetical protein [Bryobacterales bacterium]
MQQALEMHRKSIALRERLVEEQPRSPEFRRDLAIAYSNAADVLGNAGGPNLGDKAGALELCRKMVALTEGNLKADPADRRALFDHAMSLMRLGSMLPQKEAEALDTLRASLAMFERIAAADAKNRRVPGMIAFLHQRMGAMLESNNRAAALGHLEKAATISAATLAEDGNDFDRIVGYVSAHRLLAAASARAGKCAKAKGLFETLLGETPGFVAKAPTAIRALIIKPDLLQALGDAQSVCGDHGAALEAYAASVEAWKALGSHKDFGTVHETAMNRAVEALRKEQR